MTITYEQMIQSANVADQLGNSHASEALKSIAGQWKDKGRISDRQVDYASSLVDQYHPNALREHNEKVNEIETLWNNKDDSFLEWLEFLTFFFKSNRCRRYEHHVLRLNRTAMRLDIALRVHKLGVVPCPTSEIMELQKSKLHDTLRQTYLSEPLYNVGDLVVIRGLQKNFSAWSVEHSHQKWFLREGFQISIVTEVLNGTFKCMNVHKTKGSSRLYRLKAFQGGQTKDCLIEESLIKPMK